MNRPIIQKTGYKLTGKPTKAEKLRMDRIAGMGCILSYYKSGIFGTPGCVHHMLTGRVPGRRSSHMRTICLAPHYHDQSMESIHHLGIEGFERLHGISEEALFQLTNELLEVAA